MQITTRQRYLISAESLVDPRTVAKVYDGTPTTEKTRERVEEAAKKLNLPKPPKPAKESSK